ncbi:hypothetical protein FRX31_027819, partial [Thalictrum thalictroides]
ARTHESLISQLGERAQGRFSHCLPPWRLGEVPDTALQFGVDAGFQEGQQVPQYAYVLLPLALCFSRFEAVEHQTFQSCYKNKNGFVDFPSMTFHFDKADLEVGPNELFIDFGDHFCIAFLPTNTEGPSVIIGNRWMANYKFMYDLKAQQVSFAREHCKKGM